LQPTAIPRIYTFGGGRIELREQMEGGAVVDLV